MLPLCISLTVCLCFRLLRFAQVTRPSVFLISILPIFKCPSLFMSRRLDTGHSSFYFSSFLLLSLSVYKTLSFTFKLTNRSLILFLTAFKSSTFFLQFIRPKKSAFLLFVNSNINLNFLPFFLHAFICLCLTAPFDLFFLFKTYNLQLCEQPSIIAKFIFPQSFLFRTPCHSLAISPCPICINYFYKFCLFYA